jgi:hypothetical protein
MSTNKRKSAEQPAPSNHSPEQVKEVALMLYARRPSALGSITSEGEWDLLIKQAAAVLDELDKACVRVGQSPRKVGAKHRKTEKELPLNANGNVPLDEAVKEITGQEKLHIKPQQKLQRAWERFEAIPHIDYSAKRSADVYPEPQIKLWREKITHWHKNGMPPGEVIRRRELWNEKAYRHYRFVKAERAETPKKRRKPWSDQRRKKMEKSFAKQAKLKALRKAARRGEIK